jgi:transposase-like protein
MKRSVTALRSRQERAAEVARVEVQVPLPLLGALHEVRERFFSLCVSAGKQVLGAMMEQDRTALCGPKWAPNPERAGYRHGTAPGAITLGGRRITIERPRARSVDAATELELPSFRFAADRDPLDERTMEAIAVGISTRKYARSLEPLPPAEVEHAVSRSAVSRRFVALSTQFMREWLSADVSAIGIVSILIDGIAFRGHTILIALGVACDGLKHVLGLREGSTENAAVAKALLADLVERGLPTDRPILFVIDGGKGIHKAVVDLFGELAVIQRCQVHKKRNVLDHLPESMHPNVSRVLSQAYESHDAAVARRQLQALARSLDEDHPGAAASLREGLDEVLTLQRLGIGGALYRTLRSTNAIENLNGSVAAFTRNVRRWRNGAMIVRWVATALRHASRGFRRIRGHSDLKLLLRALQEARTTKTMDRTKKVA